MKTPTLNNTVVSVPSACGAMLTIKQIRLQILAALLFASTVMIAVGFAPIDAVHNAAHDTRHALAFPCH